MDKVEREKTETKGKREVTILCFRIHVIDALLAAIVERHSASGVIQVIVVYLIRKHNLVRVLTGLDGTATILNIADPCLEPPFGIPRDLTPPVARRRAQPDPPNLAETRPL